MIRSLSRHADFVEVRQKGVTSVKKPFRLTAVVQPEGDESRMGYVIPRSVGNAVRRNRVRRQLREIVRQFDGEGLLPPGSFVLAVGSHPPLTFADIRRLLAELFGSLPPRDVGAGASSC